MPLGVWSHQLGFRNTPRANLFCLRSRLSHPVTDERIEQFTESRESGLELFPDMLLRVLGVESDRGHGGLLTNPGGHDVQVKP
jgi:hypothetical protein